MIILKPKTPEEARRLTRWGTAAVSLVTILVSALMAFVLPSFGQMFKDLGVELQERYLRVLVHSHPILWLSAGASLVVISIIKDRWMTAGSAQALNAFLFFGLLALISWVGTVVLVELGRVVEAIR